MSCTGQAQSVGRAPDRRRPPGADATLALPLSDESRRQWSYRWHATAGTHRLRVRATDRDGETQTATVSSPQPDGATGYHTVQVTVR